MSKSTLSITIPAHFTEGNTYIGKRTIEVPCRLPDSFNFKYGGQTVTAELSGETPEDFEVASVECDKTDALMIGEMDEAADVAESILATIKATLGITGPVPPGSPLPAIALAYEAECAAFDAQTKAFRSLPPALVGVGLLPNGPSDESPLGTPFSPAARMLAKYVEHVVENAAAQEVK